MAQCKCSTYKLNHNGICNATVPFVANAGFIAMVTWLYATVTGVAVYALNTGTCAHNKVTKGTNAAVVSTSVLPVNSGLVSKAKALGLAADHCWAIAQAPFNSLAHVNMTASSDWVQVHATGRGGVRFAYVPASSYAKATLVKVGKLVLSSTSL